MKTYIIPGHVLVSRGLEVACALAIATAVKTAGFEEVTKLIKHFGFEPYTQEVEIDD